MILSPSEHDQLQREGFLVRRDVFTTAECEALCSAMSVFIADVASRARARGRIKPFWEAFAGSAEQNEVFWDAQHRDLLEREPEGWESAVMRIGHVLHRVAPFRSFIRDRRISEALESAINEPAEIVQSSIIYKQPQSDAVQFGWHQDSSYLPNEPESIALAFVALDPMTADNGALEILPRSHTGGLRVVYRLTTDGLSPIGGRNASVDAAGGMLLELPRGSIVFVLGRTFHASKPNRSASPRRALIVHGKAKSSRMTADSWSQGPFDSVSMLASDG
jgi:ectoine hydroxylase-related dioxygenase (phytanoyl-CoA dioxygenase family)